jgi:predicted AlkP superfamily pyrophosphatase or phosphodiesterase
MRFARAPWAWALLLALLGAWALAQTTAPPYVVLVSLDGFRSDYAQRDKARHLLAIAEQGASARALIPSFPSLTFPNHYSIVTGLYPEHHGIVANGFYDPERGAQFDPKKSTSDGFWFGGTPLWVLAEQQNVKAATEYWIGGDAEIAGRRPSDWQPFDDTIAAERRVQQILAWLRLPEPQRPHFLALYLSDADHAGHDFGPDSLQSHQAIGRLDQMIGKLRDGIQTLGFAVNLIVVSDHGMQNSGRTVDLRQYADLSGLRIVSGGPIALIYAPNAAIAERTYRSLQGKSRAFDVYRRRETPPEWHFTENRRIGDLVVIARQPCDIVANDQKPRQGNHGYDPRQYPAMNGIFYAIGPNIRPKTHVDPFENVNIYPLVARILGLRLPDRLDGSPAVLESVYQP